MFCFCFFYIKNNKKYSPILSAIAWLNDKIFDHIIFRMVSLLICLTLLICSCDIVRKGFLLDDTSQCIERPCFL